MKNQYEIDYQQGYDSANDEWLERMDKIRAEIDELEVLKFSSGERIYKDEVLDIIDKYKVESEDIEALEHPEKNVIRIVSCGDSISRQAVLKMAYDMSEIDGEHFTEPCMVVDVEDIQKLPSVNPQPKKEVEMGSEAKDFFFIKYDPESDCMVINRVKPGDLDMNAYMNKRHEKYEKIISAKSYAKAVKKYWEGDNKR